MPVEISVRPPATLAANPELRAKLLGYFIDNATGAALSNWLRDLEQDPKGSVDEKRARIRAHTQYLSMSPADFPQQTIHYLEVYPSEHLEGICEALGLPSYGSKEARWRRILRQVGYAEGWLAPPPSEPDAPLTIDQVIPFVEWHQILKRGRYEKDFYAPFAEDMAECFGEGLVHEQLPVASGNTLRIDFHIGHPQQPGVGVEFKMPTNNGELQRALGQIDQYMSRYGQNLIVVLFPDWIEGAQLTLFREQVASKGATVILK